MKNETGMMREISGSETKGSGISDLGQVHDFWNNESCGEVYATGLSKAEEYLNETISRYQLEPYILDFAEFSTFKGKDVLEIGVGMGSDHSSIAHAEPKSLIGIDLTQRAVDHTRERFKAIGMESNVKVDNAEALSFDACSFDAIYSWGVLHHSPDTTTCFEEVHRVLKPGGTAKIMIYHKYSPCGIMLWARYALMKGNPFVSMNELYSKYLESPGTKAYTINEAKLLTEKFSSAEIEVMMNFGDLLEGEVGQRHKGPLLTLAKTVYPRRLIKLIGKHTRFGLMLLITLKK